MPFLKNIFWGTVFISLSLSCFAQTDVERLHNDVSFLSDSLGNRYPATIGDYTAQRYILKSFIDSGLSCRSQSFDIVEYIWGDGSLSLQTADSLYSFSCGKDFSVTGRSATDSLSSEFIVVTGALHDSLYTKAHNKVVINYQNSPDSCSGYRLTPVSNAVKAGARALIYVNPQGQPVNNRYRKGNRFHHLYPIPVIVLNYDEAYHFSSSSSPLQKVYISTTHYEKHLNATNIIGEKRGADNHYLIIGAHYDTCGTDSLSAGLRPGANDNASGVAILLALARLLNIVETHHSLLFVAFGGEEKGLLGSDYFTSHLPVEDAVIDEMINLDMLGRMEDNILYYKQDNEVRVIPSEMKQDHLYLKPDSGTTSDYIPFAIKGLATTNFHTGADSAIHTSTDTSDRLNYYGMAKILSFLIDYILAIDNNH